MLNYALDLREKTAASVMTPVDKAYMLDLDRVLDRELLREIYTQGFSRIPIY